MVEKQTQHKSDLIFTYDMFISSVNKLVDKIKKSNNVYRNIYAVPRGGLILGVFLSHRLDLPLVTELKTANTLVVDDILDTGETLKHFNDFDKAVLTIKPKGLSQITNDKTLFYIGECDDDVWVKYFWEDE